MYIYMLKWWSTKMSFYIILYNFFISSVTDISPNPVLFIILHPFPFLDQFTLRYILFLFTNDCHNKSELLNTIILSPWLIVNPWRIEVFLHIYQPTHLKQLTVEVRMWMSQAADTSWTSQSWKAVRWDVGCCCSCFSFLPEYFGESGLYCSKCCVFLYMCLFNNCPEWVQIPADHSSRFIPILQWDSPGAALWLLFSNSVLASCSYASVKSENAREPSVNCGFIGFGKEKLGAKICQTVPDSSC